MCSGDLVLGCSPEVEWTGSPTSDWSGPPRPPLNQTLDNLREDHPALDRGRVMADRRQHSADAPLSSSRHAVVVRVSPFRLSLLRAQCSGVGSDSCARDREHGLHCIRALITLWRWRGQRDA